jgi:alkanesulfonate monooxygenase SsuD/methylene tetrahydromethanopterin reductase-like flavin-dependent oxidoreductase (luciferase family)
VWLGGTADRVVDAAGRAADGWNGWALDEDGFAARVARLRAAARDAGRDPEEVVATWGGVVLVGEDEDDLRRLREARDPDLPWAAWSGTVEDLRRFAAALEALGCAWFVAAVAGGDARAALVARALHDR